MKTYDVIVIGAGPGGYTAGLYLAQHGKKVCLIEKHKVGGTCLNYGCIPTKAMIASSDVYKIVKNASAFGIKAENVSVDYNAVKNRSDAVVQKLRRGIEFLIKNREIDFIADEAILDGDMSVMTAKERLSAANIILATGSSHLDLPFLPVNEMNVLSNLGILALTQLPKELVILGGGFIGCEYASFFNELGAKVTIIEMMPGLLPGADEEISKKLESAFLKKGIALKLNTKIENADAAFGGNVTLKASSGEQITTEKVLVSIGRKVNIDKIGLDKAGISFDKKGIKVNEKLETNIPNVYAIGDCTGRYMLAHVASYEGVVASDNILGKNVSADYRSVPYCVFTDPEIASCGLTLKLAREKGIPAVSKSFNYRALGKANALGAAEGYLKIVFNPESKKVLGIDIMGSHASDVIGECSIIIKNNLTVDSIIQTIHAHPTMPELVLEAAHAAGGHPVHTL